MKRTEIKCFNIFAGEEPTVYYACKSGFSLANRVVVLSEGCRARQQVRGVRYEETWKEEKGTGQFLAMSTKKVTTIDYGKSPQMAYASIYIFSSREIISTWEQYEAELAAEKVLADRKRADRDKQLSRERNLIVKANELGLPVKWSQYEATITWAELQTWTNKIARLSAEAERDTLRADERMRKELAKAQIGTLVEFKGWRMFRGTEPDNAMHRHCCDICGFIWEHHREQVLQLDKQGNLRTHVCPNCGHVQKEIEGNAS